MFILQFKGDIELENVTFAYPSRPDRPVFNGFSLIIPAGKALQSLIMTVHFLMHPLIRDALVKIVTLYRAWVVCPQEAVWRL